MTDQPDAIACATENCLTYAERSGDYVISFPAIDRFRNGSPSPNLGTKIEKAIKRAGLTRWPKLFQNMRASRQIELVRQGHPIHVVCDWIGNSDTVALEYYLRTIEDDFVKAVGTRNPSAGHGAGKASQDEAQGQS